MFERFSGIFSYSNNNNKTFTCQTRAGTVVSDVSAGGASTSAAAADDGTLLLLLIMVLLLLNMSNVHGA